MNKDFSPTWKNSTKPNKQRKYRFNAPLHIKGNFLNAHLSKELRQKYSMRSLRVRTGDRIKIMRGQFKKQEGKIEEVDVKNVKVYISKVEHTKRDGTKARYPIDPSNIMIVELNMDDKKRLNKPKKSESKKSDSKSEAVPVKKSQPNPVKKAVKKESSKPVKSITKEDGN